ncbi:MAG TPA: hypothetical protein VN283_04820 [Thiobacillus sp.]|nr:hypothetical protein [Thiobacillus sp.]
MLAASEWICIHPLPTLPVSLFKGAFAILYKRSPGQRSKLVIATIKLMLAVSLSASATCAFSDQATRDVGTFKRSDGITLRAVEYDVHGMMVFVGFACWFELPDGQRISVPMDAFGKSGSCLVRTRKAAAEIYMFPFPGRWFPVASRVLEFDGYQFVDATTPGKRWISSLVHTSHYFGGYLISVALFAPFAFLGAALIRKTPARSWWLALRVIWLILGILMIQVYGFLMAIYGGPYSTLVFLFILATCAMLYKAALKFFRA